MHDFAKLTLTKAKLIQDEIHRLSDPPAEGEKPKTSDVVDYSLVKNTRGYIERTVRQINGTYEHGWYDACAVMLRKLIETLIIEAFEHNNIASKIQDRNGDYFYLQDLITHTLNETTWGKLDRNTIRSLPQLKVLGDQSAHSRRYNTNLQDIKKLLPHIRKVVQELVYLADLK
jgi:hypothetical protein